MSVEADKAYLKKEGVYAHLGKIINRVIAEKPQDGHAMVEVLSRLVKDTSPPTKAEPTEKDVEVFGEEVKKARLLDKVPVDEEGEEMGSCAVPNVVDEAEMFAWTGVGLGEQESYKVLCSLRRMSTVNKDFAKIRFWGKILGTGADYWVAEAAGGEGGDGDAEDMDAPGLPGSNQYTYFVTTDLAGTWLQLPHIKHADLVAARLIRRLFTGEPKAKVVTHPFFDGREEVLLRAQIGRITADTVLCPKGWLSRGEDEPDAAPQQAEDFVMPLPSELAKKEAWMHMVMHIRKDGKTAVPEAPDEGDDSDEGKAALKAYNEFMENDPAQDVIRSITEDGLDWVVKQAGDTTLYRDPLDPTKSRSNAVAFVRSLVWPGAVTASQKGNYTNIYIGYGLKAGDPDFFPAAPFDVQDEPDDPGEQPEPQGTEEPEEPVEAADD